MEKNNDDAQRVLRRKSNSWNRPADIIRTEGRQWALQKRERLPKAYNKKMKNTGTLKLKNLEQKSDICQHDDNRIVTVSLWFVACKNFPVLWTVTLVTQRWNKCTFIKTFQIKQFSANWIVKPHLLSLTFFSKQWKHEKFH